MTSLINASNSAGVIITSDTSGNLAIQSGGNTVATITATGANAGIQVASWAAPAFSAYATSGTSCATATYTKIAFQVKEFDTANAFDNTTNYRFQPLVAGYYQVNLALVWGTSGTGFGISTIFKNGSEFKRGSANTFVAANNISSIASAIIYLNGSTDYIEGYAYQATGSTLSTYSGLNYDYFQAAMVRSA